MSAAEHLEEATLQQYYDGELSTDEMDRVRDAIEASDVEQARLSSLGRLSDLMLLVSEDLEEGAGDSANAMFDQITAKIAEDKAEGRTGLTAIEGGQSSKVSERATEERGKPKGIEPWRILVPVSTLAAAAAIAFVIWSPSEPIIVDGTEMAAPIEEEATIAVVEPPHGTEVLEVDFGENTGTVFEVEGSMGEPIAVVWINDDALGIGDPLDGDQEVEM